MADLRTNSAASLDHHSAPGPSAGAIRESPEPPPASAQGSAGLPSGWQTISEQRDFYDERDCLDPSHGLASDKLKNRNEDDVVIFDYPLNPDYLTCTSGSPPVEEGGPSPGHFSADNAIFFQVSKNELIESEKFDQIINSPPLLSRGARLGVM